MNKVKEPKWVLTQLRRLYGNDRQYVIGNKEWNDDVGGQGPPDQT